ncbi:MAG: STAS domain-containing protein [Marinobacterium sp.]|nr:STAS domain-containing protein [Marinobacterium sp.]
MSVTCTCTSDNRHVTMTVVDRFDFALHQIFRECYRDITVPGTVFTLDLQRASYMDSSALGMILLLKDHAEALGGRLVVRKPNDVVRKILEIARFERFITIEE